MRRIIFLGYLLIASLLILSCISNQVGLDGQAYESERNFTFQRLLDGRSIIITGYSGSNEIVRIPPQIRGLPVTWIGEGAFRDKGIKGVEIPDTVTRIGYQAFRNNELTSVNLPDNLLEISSYAFADNELTTINFPDSLGGIGDGAFQNNKLTSVNIPNRTRRINYNVFSGNMLTSIVIPQGVTHIGDGAFSNNNLTYVRIPSSVNSIDSRAFAGNNELTTVYLPANIEIIERFFNNTYLSAFSSYLGFLYNEFNRRAGTYTRIGNRWHFNGEALPVPGLIIRGPNVNLRTIDGRRFRDNNSQIITRPVRGVRVFDSRDIGVIALVLLPGSYDIGVSYSSGGNNLPGTTSFYFYTNEITLNCQVREGGRYTITGTINQNLDRVHFQFQ